jgi:hypothetical protein
MSHCFIPFYKTTNETPVAMRTTHRISTFKIRATNAAMVRRIRGRSHGISKANRIVTARRRPTKEQNIPAITFLK